MVGDAQHGVIQPDSIPFLAIAAALGKPHREVDFMTLDPRDAMRAFMSKKVCDQFDWAAHEKRWKHWLWSFDMEGGVFDEDLHRQFLADLEKDPYYQEALAELNRDDALQADDDPHPPPEPEP